MTRFNLLATTIACEMTGPPQTIEDVIAIVKTWADLAPTRRRDLVSALASAARIAGLPADMIPFSASSLREHVLLQPAAAHGMSRSRRRNILSSMKFVAVRLGVIPEPLTAMSDEWAALLALLDQRKRLGLTTLARYGTYRGIEPLSLSANAVEEFVAYLEDGTLTAFPRKLAADSRLVWNRAAESVLGWPGQPLPKMSNGRQYTLPLESFTQSFRDDLERFGANLAGDPFNDLWLDPAPTGTVGRVERRYVAKPLRQITIELRKSHCRWAASALVRSGVPIEQIRSLLDLVAPIGRVMAILRFLYDHAGGRPSSATMHVSAVLGMIAKYHTMPPSGQEARSGTVEHRTGVSTPLEQPDITRIVQLGKKMKVTYEGMTAKNRTTMALATDPVREAKLLALSAELMRQAKATKKSKPHAAASLAFRATLTEFLLRYPLRQQNIRELRMDRHLVRADPRRSRITGFDIPAEETKNSHPIRFQVSEEMSEFLNIWITDFRPLFGASGNPFLFPGGGSADKPVTPQALRDAVKGVTKHLVGVTITPHQFRHLAAHNFLKAFPGEFETVRQFLGHKLLATTMKFYAGTQTETALRRLDELIEGKRTRRRKPSIRKR